MNLQKITIVAHVDANIEKAWTYYTDPNHIINWNFADPSWHCPSAENDMQIGGVYNARMEARDGSFGFDFIAVYTEIKPGESFTYGFDNREVRVEFKEMDDYTLVTVTFDPESENPIDLQQAGWQAILNNFKTYTETN